jgi:hypothetical protein
MTTGEIGKHEFAAHQGKRGQRPIHYFSGTKTRAGWRSMKAILLAKEKEAKNMSRTVRFSVVGVGPHLPNLKT